MLNASLAGFALGGGLIVAIGAQNAFVIRQGVLNQHVFWVCLFCAFSDAILIWAGTFGLGILLQQMPLLMPIMTYGGAAFLFWYGIKAFRRALNPQSLNEDAKSTTNLWMALTLCAAFTWLNPHVYLDTVVLVGWFHCQCPAAGRASGICNWRHARVSAVVLCHRLWCKSSARTFVKTKCMARN